MSGKIDNPGIPLVCRSSSSSLHMYTTEDGTGGGGGGGGGGDGKQLLLLPRGKHANVGYRLAKRKEIFFRRRYVCDCALVFGMLGLALAVAETECCLAGYYTKADISSVLVKSSISVTTAAQLAFVAWFHVLDVKMYMVDNSLDDWRLALSPHRITIALLELAAYAPHPVPCNLDSILPETHANATTGAITAAENGGIEPTPYDAWLMFPMIVRFALAFRVYMLHSRVFTDASCQSLGAMNRIHINFRFVFKSLMSMHSGYLLTFLVAFTFVVACWLMRACEMYQDSVHHGLLNSMWLIAIAYLTIGYGDIVPMSYCGRTVAVVTGIFGTGWTALVVAVLARKLQLSRAEKHVHNFVMDFQLDKQYKIAAANVLKYGWFVYRYRTAGKLTQARDYQRRLLTSVRAIRDIKQEQRRLTDSGITVVELHNAQSAMQATMEKVDAKQGDASQRLIKMEQKLQGLEHKVDTIVSLLLSQSVSR